MAQRAGLLALLTTFLLAVCDATSQAQSRSNVHAMVNVMHGLPSEERNVTAQLLKTWGLGDKYQFAEYAANSSISTIRNNLEKYSALIIVAAGQNAPLRRSQQPFLSVLGEAINWLPVAAINKAAEAIEAVTGRPLFPVRIELAELYPGIGWQPGRPIALFDVSQGHLVIDHRLQDGLQALPEHLVERFATPMFDQLGHIMRTVAPDESEERGAWLVGLAAKATAGAAAIAVASQVPLWYCISCCVVLSTLAPFAFNLGLGAVADQVCKDFSLSADECFDVWIGFVGLAATLSFAAVFPILKVCKLTECVRNPAALSGIF